MLDIISMTTLLIVMIIFGLVLFFTLCIIIGGNANQSEYEQRMEDEEQMNYIKNYKNKKFRNRQN